MIKCSSKSFPRAGGVGLPSKHEALSLNPYTAKKPKIGPLPKLHVTIIIYLVVFKFQISSNNTLNCR
jgi:hypothetical protein